MPKLSACIQEKRIILHLQALKKMEAIRELAMRLEGADEIADVKRFLSLVIQREKIETTAVGHGVAIPHAHGDCVGSLVIGVGISRQGIDFGAADGEAVRVIVIIASPVRSTTPGVFFSVATRPFGTFMIMSISPARNAFRRWLPSGM